MQSAQKYRDRAAHTQKPAREGKPGGAHVTRCGACRNTERREATVAEPDLGQRGRSGNLITQRPFRLGFETELSCYEHTLDDTYRLHRRRNREFITAGDNEPSGFVLTTILGIVGAFVTTYLGQGIGWYRADESVELIGVVVGVVVGLVIWGLIAGRRSRTA